SRAGLDRVGQRAWPAGPRLHRRVVIATPASIYLPQPNHLEETRVEHQAEAALGRGVGACGPACLEPGHVMQGKAANLRVLYPAHVELSAIAQPEHRPRVAVAALT